MKYELRPKDLTVRMLLTLSEISEPMNFYERSDLEVMCLIIEMWITLEIIITGEKAMVIIPIFQE